MQITFDQLLTSVLKLMLEMHRVLVGLCCLRLRIYHWDGNVTYIFSVIQHRYMLSQDYPVHPSIVLG